MALIYVIKHLILTYRVKAAHIVIDGQSHSFTLVKMVKCLPRSGYGIVEKLFQWELFRVADAVFTFQNLYEVFSKMLNCVFYNTRCPTGNMETSNSASYWSVL